METHRQPLAVVVAIRRRDGGDVSIVDCETLSRCLGVLLDEAELFAGAFVLEVSSPGLGETLVSDRDFRSFRGFPVEICCRRQGQDDVKVIRGTLMGRDESVVQVNRKGRITRVARENVLQVRLTTGEFG